jgi:hypothetical protein
MSARLGQEVTAVGLVQATVHGDQAAVEILIAGGAQVNAHDCRAWRRRQARGTTMES